MGNIKLARIIAGMATISALSGCFVSAGGTTDLDPGNPYGPQIGGQVYYDVSTGQIYPGLTIGAGPFYLGF